jgi:hypothetical protein
MARRQQQKGIMFWSMQTNRYRNNINEGSPRTNSAVSLYFSSHCNLPLRKVKQVPWFHLTVHFEENSKKARTLDIGLQDTIARF